MATICMMEGTKALCIHWKLQSVVCPPAISSGAFNFEVRHSLAHFSNESEEVCSVVRVSLQLAHNIIWTVGYMNTWNTFFCALFFSLSVNWIKMLILAAK